MTLQVGFFVGARRIANVLITPGAEFQASHKVFSEFTDAVPRYIPVGSARLMWEPEAILRSDLKLAPVEERFRAKLLAEYAAVIRLYDCPLRRP